MDSCTALETLELKLGYHFSSRSLIQEALTHKSYRNEHPDDPVGDNERLEFLGDAVLDLVVSRHLFFRYPQLPEGELTRVRAEVVHEGGLAGLGQSLGVGDALRLGRGEERTGGRQKDSLVADGTEAVLGALLCDAGYEAAEPVILSLIEQAVVQAVERKTVLDSKSLLQEILQGRFGQPPVYRVLKAEGPDHSRCYTVDVALNALVLGQGTGRTKKSAQQQAAEMALKKLEDL